MDFQHRRAGTPRLRWPPLLVLAAAAALPQLALGPGLAGQADPHRRRTSRRAAPPTRSPAPSRQPLPEALGQPVVVENRAGAGGNIAGDVVAKSPADGYTLLMSSGGMVSVNPHIYTKMAFDPAKDLMPVAAAARVLVFLVVKPDAAGRTTCRSSSPTSRPTRAS